MMAGRSFLLEPPITGDRTYVHGADIFDGIVFGALAARGGALADVRLTLTAASDCAIEVCEDDAAAQASADRCGVITWRDAGVRRQLVLRRRRDRPISTRLPLDEDLLVDGARFDGDRAALPAGDAPLMRRVAAASLHLLRGRGPRAHWAIAEIACARLPPRRAAASVTLTRLLGGRYWRATATVPDGGGGTMLLASGEPRR